MSTSTLKRAQAAIAALKLARLQRVCLHTFENDKCIHCNIKSTF